MSTLTNNGFVAQEDANIRTRKQWSDTVAVWCLPQWLQIDSLEEADAARVLRFFCTNFRNQRGQKAYVSDTYGTWLLLDGSSLACQAVIRAMIVAARREAAGEVYENVIDVALVEKTAYQNYLSNDLTLASHHIVRVSRQLSQQLLAGDECDNVAAEDFDRRNAHPVIPLADGGGLDLTTGLTTSPGQLSSHLYLSRGWILPMLDPDIRSAKSDGACAMRTAIHDRFGQTLITRLARHALGTSKSIDVLVAPKNWGKSTLITLMERAFPGMVARVEAGRALSPAGDHFSVVTSLLSEKLWVFIDESGGKTDKMIHGSMLKTWVDDMVSVEKKYENRVSKSRLGTAIFVGYDYPSVEMSDQGMPERFQWAYQMPDNPMSQKERDLLMTEDAMAFFRQSVMSRAVALWQQGNMDAECQTSETREAIAEFILKRQNPLASALKERYELGDKNDFVPSSDVMELLEEASEDGKSSGKLVADTMALAFHSPQVIATKKKITGKSVRGWKGLRLRTTAEEKSLKND